jgi:hypothetical protein
MGGKAPQVRAKMVVLLSYSQWWLTYQVARELRQI